ncbi:unannotated protein [freshwater metagenome]|uniref:Unannotated protein n=1 Tax=freshwater metagenome TaxID=449393 RepID=A0A6J6W259_9ZZZZ
MHGNVGVLSGLCGDGGFVIITKRRAIDGVHSLKSSN